MSTRRPAPHPTQIIVRDLAPTRDTAVTGGGTAKEPLGGYLVYKYRDLLVTTVHSGTQGDAK